MDPELLTALRTIHKPSEWVHLGTIGKGGEPHVAPVMMVIRDDVLLFSLTGKQKKRNLERDPRACASLARENVMSHVIVWGTMTLHHDDEAQQLWDWMITEAFGAQGLEKRRRPLSLEGTSLGIFRPTHHRIYQVT